MADRHVWSVNENWDDLARYCDEGDIEGDNDGAERSLRGVGVGKTNHPNLTGRKYNS